VENENGTNMYHGVSSVWTKCSAWGIECAECCGNSNTVMIYSDVLLVFFICFSTKYSSLTSSSLSMFSVRLGHRHSLRRLFCLRDLLEVPGQGGHFHLCMSTFLHMGCCYGSGMNSQDHTAFPISFMSTSV